MPGTYPNGAIANRNALVGRFSCALRPTRGHSTALLQVNTVRGAAPGLIPHTSDMPTSPSDDVQCMAAAADRLLGDVFERVSPELVLVDAALAEEMRRRLDVPDDTLVRIGRMRIEPRLPVHAAEFADGDETEVEKSALAGAEPLPVPATALEDVHRDVDIEDLIVLPEGDPPSFPPTLLVAPDECVTRLAAAPKETVAPRVSGLDHPMVVPAEDQAEPRGSYPRLPSPSSDADEEDASSVVLRQIRYHTEPDTPPKRRRRLLSFVSVFAALSSMAMFAVDVQLGVSELPHWLPS
jgi:hypothetical protein